MISSKSELHQQVTKLSLGQTLRMPNTVQSKAVEWRSVKLLFRYETTNKRIFNGNKNGYRTFASFAISSFSSTVWANQKAGIITVGTCLNNLKLYITWKLMFRTKNLKIYRETHLNPGIGWIKVLIWILASTSIGIPEYKENSKLTKNSIDMLIKKLQ